MTKLCFWSGCMTGTPLFGGLVLLLLVGCILVVSSLAFLKRHNKRVYTIAAILSIPTSIAGFWAGAELDFRYGNVPKNEAGAMDLFFCGFLAAPYACLAVIAVVWTVTIYWPSAVRGKQGRSDGYR